MTLATFYSDISATLNRGTSQDTKIPGWARRGAKWLEENYTLSHMRQYGEVTLDPDAEVPQQADFPDALVKRFEYVRVRPTDEGEDFRYLPQVTPRDVSALSLGEPSGFYLEDPYIWFDSKVQEGLTLEIAYDAYTDWPTDTAATPEILRRYELTLRARVLLNAAIDLKDPRMIDTYKGELADALSTGLRAQLEGESSDRLIMRPRLG